MMTAFRRALVFQAAFVVLGTLAIVTTSALLGYPVVVVR